MASFDRAELHDRLATAISKWHRDPEQPLYTQGADAALKALAEYLDIGEAEAWCKACRRVWEGPHHQCEPNGQGIALSEAERTMLTYALDQAQENIWAQDGFTDENQAAVDSLRRLTVKEPQKPGRVKHSGPRTEFCVLCLSGEHERVAEEQQGCTCGGPITSTTLESGVLYEERPAQDVTESVEYKVAGNWGVDSANSAEDARAAVAKWLRAYPTCGAYAEQRIVREWEDGSEFYGPWTPLPESASEGEASA